jgi:hypothetical protein
MTIATITISGNNYISYASVAEANVFLVTDPVRATIWNTLTVDQKGINLVAATRRLDGFRYKGEKTGADNVQDNQFPRTGLVYPDGTDVGTTEIPYDIEIATILLAGTIASNAEAAQATDSSSNIKKVKAGSAEVEYFNSVSGVPLQDSTAYNFITYWLASEQSNSSVSLGFGFYNDPIIFDWL